MPTLSRFGDSKRILIVDDDKDTVDSMACLLRHFGHEVQIARNGYDAIEIARREQPQYVLLDLALPGLDGLKVASQLRQELHGPLVLIAVTGYGREEDRRDALAAGFDHHFLKPVEMSALNTVLSGHDDGTSNQQESPRDQANLMAKERVATSDSFLGESNGSPIGRYGPRSAGPPTAVISPKAGPIVELSRHVEITSPLGLHLRAADKFVQLARQFQANVRVVYDGRRVSGRSVLDLMTLAAACGTWLDVEADGPDARTALDALTDLIAREFDERPHGPAESPATARKRE